MTNAALREKPDAGNPNVAPSQRYGGISRFDGGGVALSATPRRSSQLWKRILLSAIATLVLASIPVQGQSSAEATFDSFSSEFRTSASAEATTFLSRYRTVEDSAALSSFDSREPTGFIIVIH